MLKHKTREIIKSYEDRGWKLFDYVKNDTINQTKEEIVETKTQWRETNAWDELLERETSGGFTKVGETKKIVQHAEYEGNDKLVFTRKQDETPQNIIDIEIKEVEVLDLLESINKKVDKINDKNRTIEYEWNQKYDNLSKLYSKQELKSRISEKPEFIPVEYDEDKLDELSKKLDELIEIYHHSSLGQYTDINSNFNITQPYRFYDPKQHKNPLNTLYNVLLWLTIISFIVMIVFIEGIVRNFIEIGKPTGIRLIVMIIFFSLALLLHLVHIFENYFYVDINKIKRNSKKTQTILLINRIINTLLFIPVVISLIIIATNIKFKFFDFKLPFKRVVGISLPLPTFKEMNQNIIIALAVVGFSLISLITSSVLSRKIKK